MKPESARQKVNVAVKKGVLSRPDTCERCGATPPPASDGRSQIHGHHHDYAKPLDVEWICAACHRKETRLPDVMGAPVYGERNGQAKLNEAAVKEILASPLGCRRLAKQFNVDKRTIQRVRQGIHWIAASPSAQKETGK